MGEEVGVRQERVRLEKRDSGEVPRHLGLATKAVQSVRQAAVQLAATENGAELHLRAPGPAPRRAHEGKEGAARQGQVGLAHGRAGGSVWASRNSRKHKRGTVQSRSFQLERRIVSIGQKGHGIGEECAGERGEVGTHGRLRRSLVGKLQASTRCKVE